MDERTERSVTAFLKQLAAMTKDGELLEGEEFDLSSDDAVDSLHWAIDTARELISED